MLGATDQQHISIDDVDEETPKQGSSAGSQRGDQVPRTGLGAVCACFSVEYYRPYFNVDTKDVAKRMLLTFYPPQTPSFSEMTAENPDLYGPIWIAATLVFLLGAMSNFAKWASFKPEDSTSIWKYDFTLVTLATVFIFSFMAVMGLLSWAFLRYIGVRLAAVRFDKFCWLAFYCLQTLPLAGTSATPRTLGICAITLFCSNCK